MISRHHTRDGECVLHHQGGQFYRWTGTHYLETTPEDVRAEAYRFLEGAFHVEADKEPVPFTPNKSRVDTAMDALRAEVHLNSAIRAPAWLGNATTDRPPARELLACRNGLLHLPTRRLLEHSPQFFAVNALGYDYEGDAPAPARWLDFLRTVWPHDPESVGTLQEIFGLLLTGETRHQKIFLVVGPKRSGKGTIGRILTTMLGRENVCNPTLAALSQNFGLAPLIGKPLALISDARLSGRADVHVVAERLLSISGEDGQTIDRKHMPAWTGTLPTRFMVLSNELPRLTDASGALAGRFIILQMRQSFYGCEDLGLTEKLLPELPGIFNWALTGLDRLTARGHFVQPASAREAIADLEELASPVGAFIKERCTTGPGHTVSRNDLFAAWVAWCRDEGREHPGTAAGFGRDLRAAIPTLGDRFTRAGGALHRQYTGIGLLPHATAVSQGLF